MKSFVLASLLVGAVCLSFCYGADPAKEEKTGLKIGSKAPAFKLNDQTGKERSLDDLLHEGDKTAVVFFRSADWCPFCIKHLVQLEQGRDKLAKNHINLVGISYDSVELLDKFTKKQKIGFPLLSDPEHRTIIDFGVLNKEAKGKTEGIPYPGVMIVDSKGVIRAKLFFESYRDRPGVEEILKLAEGVK
jgi:peroxiredoxin